MKIKKADVWAVTSKAFPEYKGRKFGLTCLGKILFHDLNWSGGSKNYYRSVSLDGKESKNLFVAPPWANPAEGKEIEIPSRWVVVQRCFFQGHDLGLTVHCNKDDMAYFLPLSSEEKKEAKS